MTGERYSHLETMLDLQPVAGITEQKRFDLKLAEDKNILMKVSEITNNTEKDVQSMQSEEVTTEVGKNEDDVQLDLFCYDAQHNQENEDELILHCEDMHKDKVDNIIKSLNIVVGNSEDRAKKQSILLVIKRKLT